MTPKTFSIYIYQFIAVHCSIIIREAFFCNRWNKYKGPQPDILKIMGDLGTFNPNFPLLWAQGNPQKRRWKECKIRGDEAYIKQTNKQQRPLNQQEILMMYIFHISSQRLRQYAQDLLGSVPLGVLKLKEVANTRPHP